MPSFWEFVHRPSLGTSSRLAVQPTRLRFSLFRTTHSKACIAESAFLTLSKLLQFQENYLNF